MPDDLSVAAAFALLWVVGALRGVATYAVGRGARRAGEGREVADRLFARPGMVRAQEVVARWGALSVVASYLAFGLQTAVCATAGLLRLPVAHVVPAVVVGSALRAGLYTLVGVAVLVAWLRGEWTWLLAAVLALGLLAAATAWWRRRSRRM